MQGVCLVTVVFPGSRTVASLRLALNNQLWNEFSECLDTEPIISFPLALASLCVESRQRHGDAAQSLLDFHLRLVNIPIDGFENCD